MTASTALSMPRLSVHRVWPAATDLHAFAEDRLGEHGGGRGAVAGDVGGLAGDFLDHLRAHVFERVFEFDFFGDGDAVFGDGRGAERFFDDDVAAFGAERHRHRVGENIHAPQNRVPRISINLTILAAIFSSLDYLKSYFSMTPRMSSSRMIRCSSPSILISVPEYFPNRIRSLTLTSSGVILPSSLLSLSNGDDFAFRGFSFAVSGMMIPPLVFSSSSIRLTMTRSCKGLIFHIQPPFEYFI